MAGPTRFQANRFQNDRFQIDSSAVTTPAAPTDISQSFVEDRHGRLRGQRVVRRIAARAVLSHALTRAIRHKIATRTKTVRI
jgi:hypothetical protein